MDSGSEGRLSSCQTDGASRDLAVSKALLDKSIVEQSRLASSVNVMRTADYLVRTEDRLSTLRTDITALSSEISQEAKNASLVALTRAEHNLQNAKSFMSEGKVEETVDELVELKENEEDSRKQLESATATIDNVEEDRP